MTTEEEAVAKTFRCFFVCLAITIVGVAWSIAFSSTMSWKYLTDNGYTEQVTTYPDRTISNSAWVKK